MGLSGGLRGVARSLWKRTATPFDLIDATRAAALLPIVELGLRVLGLPRTARLLGVELDFRQANLAARPSDLWLRDAAIVARVVSLWPATGKCLREGLILASFLSDRGATLRIGVRPAPAGAVDIHAWVELGGQRVCTKGLSPINGYRPLRRPT